jgi:hypothetical protein
LPHEYHDPPKRFSWTGAVCTCQLEFTSENDIDQTPKYETIRLYAGNAFDMTGERNRTEYRPDFNARWLTCQDKSYRKKPNVLRKKVLDSCDKRGPGRSHFGAALLGETTGGQLKADPIDFHDAGTLFGGKAGTPCLRVGICAQYNGGKRGALSL